MNALNANPTAFDRDLAEVWLEPDDLRRAAAAFIFRVFSTREPIAWAEQCSSVRFDLLHRPRLRVPYVLLRQPSTSTNDAVTHVAYSASVAAGKLT